MFTTLFYRFMVIRSSLNTFGKFHQSLMHNVPSNARSHNRQRAFHTRSQNKHGASYSRSHNKNKAFYSISHRNRASYLKSHSKDKTSYPSSHIVDKTLYLIGTKYYFISTIIDFSNLHHEHHFNTSS